MAYKGHCNSCRKDVEFDEGESGDTKGSKGKKRTFIKGTCPVCGSKVLDWQSKYAKPDKPSKAQPLAVLEPEPDAESSPPDEPLEIIPSLEGDSGDDFSEEEPEEEIEVILPEDVEVDNPQDAPGQPEKKEEEESDWTEYLPIIIIVIGLIIAIVGIWWTTTKDEKKDDKKKEKGD